jgi:hypothetical protein
MRDLQQRSIRYLGLPASRGRLTLEQSFAAGFLDRALREDFG